jgi:PAS domain S-box-containing protein
MPRTKSPIRRVRSNPLILPKQLAYAALEASLDGVVLADADHRLIYVNKSFLEIFGFDDQNAALTLRGNDLWKYSEKAREVADGLRSGKAYMGETLGRRLDGSDVYLRLWVTPIIDEQTGSFVASISSMQDITDRHVMDQKLRASEAKSRAIADNLPIGIVECSVDGIIEFLNPAAQRIFGSSGAELTGCNVSALYEEPLKSQLVQRMLAYQQGGEVAMLGKGVFPATARRLDGENVPVEISFTKFRDVSGEHFIGAVMDTSARRSAERSLTIAQAALASSLDAIALMDLSGRVTWANGRYLEMFGLEGIEQISSFVPEDHWLSSEDAQRANPNYSSAGLFRVGERSLTY